MAKKKLNLSYGTNLEASHAHPYFGHLPCQYCPRPAKHTAHGHAWCDAHLPPRQGIQASVHPVAGVSVDNTDYNTGFDEAEAKKQAQMLADNFNKIEALLGNKPGLIGTMAVSPAVAMAPKVVEEPIGAPEAPASPPGLPKPPPPLDLGDADAGPSGLREAVMGDSAARGERLEIDFVPDTDAAPREYDKRRFELLELD